MLESLLTYERPAIEVLEGIEAFFDRVLYRKLDVPDDTDWRTKKIKEFIDAHPTQAGRNLDEVCRELELSMSGRQARRLFKLSIGVGVREYAKSRRLSVALEQLEVTKEPVKAIAANLGFQSTRQFRRRFKEFFGLSPVEFRRVSWRRTSVED
jgi:methylphosphotriester-DNA--protein-cysteine methyltransferase